MAKYNFLCADIGTTSLKTALVSENGQVLSFYQHFYKNKDKSKIALEWIEGLKTSIKKIKEDVSSKSDIKSQSGTVSQTDITSQPGDSSQQADFKINAIAISGNGPTIVSEDGTTLLWNEETPEAKKIAGTFYQSLFLPRIRAFTQLYKNKITPETKLFSGPEYLIWYLTNNQITILPEVRFEFAYWNDDALESIGVNKNQFGKFVKPAYNCGPCIKYEEFGLEENIPVIAGGPDFTVAMIGTNTLSPGSLCDCAGSSEGINLCTPKPFFSESIRTLPSIIPDLWNAAVLMPSSGVKFVECKTKFDDSISYPDYIDYCFENKTSDGYKTMSSLADNVKTSLNILLKAAAAKGIEVKDTMMVTGGQAKNDKWMQLKADTVNYKLCITETPDSELIGDAVLAACGIGLYSDIKTAADNIVKQSKTFTPKNSN